MTAKKLQFKNSRPLKYFIFRLTCVVIAVMMTSCEQNATTPNEPPKPPGYQEDIYWPSLADSPWPMYQHDPQYTGRSNYKGPQNGQIINEFTFTGFAEFSGILVSKNNEIYFTALNLSSLNNPSVLLSKLNANFNLLWNLDVSLNGSTEIMAKPILDYHDNIYTGAYAGYLISSDSSGKVNWNYDTNEVITCGFAGINLDKYGNIYFSTTNSFYKLDKLGSKLFELSEYHSSPIVFDPYGTNLFCINNSNGLDALNLNGDLIWHYPFTSYWSPIPICDSDGNIYLSENDSTFISVDSKGNLRWKYFIERENGNNSNDRIETHSVSAIDKNGNIFFRTIYSLYSLDYSGKLRWFIELPDAEGSTLLCDVEGTIYTATFGWDNTSGARLYSISNSGVINWETSFGTGVYIRGNSFALSSDGSLFIMITNMNSIPYNSKLLVIK